MTGQPGTPNLLAREPIAAAAGVTGAVTALLAAFWAVASDENWLSSLQPNTVLLVNGAIIIVVSMLANWWARRHSTATAAPTIAQGTVVRTTDAAGAVTGSTTV
jgi:hypothetical protein